MWSAGITWNAEGYELACVHDGGRQVPPAEFRANDVQGIVQYLAETCGADVAVVVDSTNGLLDGPLRNVGLCVLRADPWNVPPRPDDGFVPAPELARCGAVERGSLTETDDRAGALTGREGELRRAIAASSSTEAALAGRGRLVTRGPGTARRVAVTFDDGPTQPYTDRVLDILRDYGVPATFFCVGLHAHADPASVARITEAGHSVGNHTWSHPYVPDLARDEMLRQLEWTNRSIAAATGATPRLARPPYGARTPESLGWLADQGMTTVLWDRDSGDWAAPGVPAIVDNAIVGVTSGSVILMHDGAGDRSQTVAALPRVIEALVQDGYELVTVDRLLAGD
ncbi:polysaccharide deacetylase family protein [Streptomyces sp. BP-8]|uniref:Polysaccharide deacetylase family protein n=1 Tax=Streptomyces sirii TaxID=3127701 RepID=A0ABZ2QF28_9ACTN